MGKKYSHQLSRGSGKSLIAALVALSLVLITSLSAFAATVNISDRAGILDANRVRNEASSLQDRLDIYTTSNFNGTVTSFNQEAIRSIPNPNSIVMAISTNLQYVSIVGGRSVGLSNSQYTDATNSFINDYKSNHNYTSATIAAIDSLRNALGGSGIGGPVPGGSVFGGGTLCCIGLLVIAGIALFAFVRRRSGGGGFFNRQNYDPNYNQPYNQPGYPPNSGPGYPPNQGGMNPWAAGGLGAAAGGLFGYELGKEAGERDRGNDGGNFGGGGDFGGGAGGSFGGDGGGFGSGGDFGGGAGGNFGGDGGGGGFGGDGGGGGFGGDNNSGGGDFGGGAGGNL